MKTIEKTDAMLNHSITVFANGKHYEGMMSICRLDKYHICSQSVHESVDGMRRQKLLGLRKITISIISNTDIFHTFHSFGMAGIIIPTR